MAWTLALWCSEVTVTGLRSVAAARGGFVCWVDVRAASILPHPGVTGGPFVPRRVGASLQTNLSIWYSVSEEPGNWRVPTVVKDPGETKCVCVQ